MNDKPLAILVTATVIAPVCAVCILGPVALGSIIAGLFGRLAGLDPSAMLGLGAIVAIIAFAYFSRMKAGLDGRREEGRPLERISTRPGG